jgi:Spy/CpxP family protein refolding chaperone
MKATCLIQSKDGVDARRTFRNLINTWEITMKNVWMAVAAGCLLAVTGCSQPYGAGMGMGMGMGMRGDDAGACGYGMGPGMMGGYRHGDRAGCGEGSWQAHHGMGPGMMGGYGMAGLDLSSEQRAKMAEIRTEFGRKQAELSAQMQALRGRPGGVWRDGPFDEQAARQSHDAMTALRQQMFENALEARKRVDGVLSPQQRELLRSRPVGR